VLATRASDVFLLGTAEDPMTLANVFGLQPSLTPKDFSLLVGIPGVSASGLVALVHEAALAVERSPYELNPAALRAAIAKIQGMQRGVLQYMNGDQDTLNWLVHQEGGKPVIVLTTEQQAKAARGRSGGPGLETRGPSDAKIIQDYPLCLLDAPWVSSSDQAAARFVHSYFLRPEIERLVRQQGYAGPSDAPTVQDEAAENFNQSIAFLLDHWSDIRRPIALSVVVDVSSSMEGAKLEAVKRQVELFFSTSDRGGERGPTSLVSFSTKADVVVDFSTDASELRNGIQRLKSSGGSAFRDSVLRALGLYNESTFPNHRKAVVAITDGRDTSSSNALEAFRAKAEQIIGQKGVMLYVVGIGASAAEFGEIPELVASIGGRFIQTDLGNLAGALAPIWKEVR